MIIAGCQLDIAWEDKRANFARVTALVDAQPLPRGSLLALPEMFATGFSMNVGTIREPAGGETERFLGDLARARGLTVVAGVVGVGSDGRGRNEAVVFDASGREQARYCKLHPFSYSGESQHYAPGERVVTFTWGGATVAPFICYDLRFPEAFRVATRRGAEVMVVIANWPAAREAHWLALLRARAIENQAYVLGINRVGDDPRLAYSGRSLVVDPRGEVLADGGSQPGIVRASVDLEQLAAYRREFPALADMRSDLG